MIVQKKDNKPDLSGIDLEKWLVTSTLNPDGETYTLKLEWCHCVPYTITAMQGRIQLEIEGKFEDVEVKIHTMDRKAQLCWEYATEWRYDSVLLQEIATQFGWEQNDIDEFFTKASRIK